ncbi:hypothetical protein OIV83_003628 [Microbotryomycetes sp. JL201]|nr:hypothetical protein OIV83_003628 [Microbotryomycetes sp. JL201]
MQNPQPDEVGATAQDIDAPHTTDNAAGLESIASKTPLDPSQTRSDKQSPALGSAQQRANETSGGLNDNGGPDTVIIAPKSGVRDLQHQHDAVPASVSAPAANTQPIEANAEVSARSPTVDDAANGLNKIRLETAAQDQESPASSVSLVPAPEASTAPLLHQPQPAEVEEEWPLKQIAWPPLPPPPSDSQGQTSAIEPFVKIVCQNANGPCSLIALCNILILRGDMVIEQSRDTVTYTYLSTMIANHVLANSTAATTISVEKVLEILPSTRYGLNLNPRFGSIDGFKQSQGDETWGTGELDLFATSRVPLLHGWVVDPQDTETWDVVVENIGDYDAAMEKVVAGKEIAGEDVQDDEHDEQKLLEMIRRRSLWTPEQEDIVRQAHVVQKFLSSSQTQLTYHGLFLLSSQLAPSSLSALFRNSHLSVLYRRLATPTPHNTPQLGTEGPVLFTLVTDATFVHEPSVVWESLEDVEGALSDFYDGALRKTSVRGGEYVRSNASGDEERMTRREQERMERWRREEAEQLQVEAFSRQGVNSTEGGQDSE